MKTLIIYASKTGITEKCAKNINAQLKDTAYFICCGFNENWKKYYEQNIPKDLLDNAITYDTFGGEIDIKKQKGFDKFMTKIVSKRLDENREKRILSYKKFY